MKIVLFILTVISVGSGCNSNRESSPSEKETTPLKKETSTVNKELPTGTVQIKSAVLAAPLEKRDSCTVYGYSADTQLVLLRKGSNELICLADDPKISGFSVACYVKELEPFMQRGRELRKQGIENQQLFDEREKEVKEGSLQMPKQPAALYVYSAKDEDIDPATGEVKNGYLRSVIYIPYATAASTGLPEQPAGEGMPWIMHPGTHGAHIMINPKK
jgi:hypothetical protein